MSHIGRRGHAGLTSIAVALLASTAAAQVDVNPPLPNVMLLVDSSGSMEYKTSSTSYPTCNPSTSGSEKSRWIDLVEVLTGSIPNASYHCESIERNLASFRSEYSLSGTSPADYRYPVPYHRLISGLCTPKPGVLPTNAYDFPSNSIVFGQWNSSVTCSDFVQNHDGLLDAFQSQIRFGLMTFDTSVDPGTGVSGTSPDPVTGVAGTWSYFIGSPAQGNPADCSLPRDQEVGARNAAAPPWEGRMVAFGPPDATTSSLSARNDQIQKVLLATRPFGGTPIAGILDDARNFFWNDNSADPLDASQQFGPRDDPYVAGSCRDNYIILLTDGEPNLDLRPSCEQDGSPPGVCPYPDKPEEVAQDLAAGSAGAKVKTFVIGFSLSDVTLSGGENVDCTTLSENDLTGIDGLCATHPSDSALQVCCTLNRIAYEGETEHAYFANNVEQLRAALSEVLSKAAKSTTSRTLPVFASASGSTSGAASFRFFTSFLPRIQGTGLWKGVIERQRYVCEDPDNNGTLEPILKPITESAGDDFVANVDDAGSGNRTFYTVVGAASGGSIYSDRSIRPNVTTSDDGLGTYSGALVTGDVGAFPATVDPRTMAMPTATCIADGLASSACRDRYIKWLIGGDNGTEYNRCPTPGAESCSLIADVYHSTPVVVNRPSAELRDETYEQFVDDYAKRPVVLYTSTNDGLLHAFKVASNDPDDTTTAQKVETKTNNELWAFIPPAVLPSIPSEYPNVHSRLLDGVPVVRDVPAVENAGKYRFERTLADFTGNKVTWRTVLVQSFGEDRGGYFALDVTDPVSGPQFLWQLTTDDSGNALFGSGGSTPALATLYFDAGDGLGAHEIAVAILPGGDGESPDPNTTCTRANPAPSGVDSAFVPRTQVPCYQGTARRGRSLTVARLDTGEIIRTFRRAAADAPASVDTNVLGAAADIDSPITGQPVAYPGWPGAIADRVYVGDRDGTLWRADLSSTSPSDWTMALFFDAYSGAGAHAGEPIATVPVVSTDEDGNVTVAFSTGDQDVLAATPNMETFLYSLTEHDNSTYTGVESHVNWYYRFTDGERVAGPISLFSSGLYFSTYKPEPSSGGNACGPGFSRVGGMHYTEVDSTASPSDGSESLSRGGRAWLPEDGDPNSTNRVQFLDQTSNLIESGAIIFGVGVSEVPSCVTEDSVPDTFFGSGTHVSLSNASSATYQLVMQTGSVGTNAPGGSTNIVSIDLPSPDNSPRIDSWAAVLQ